MRTALIGLALALVAGGCGSGNGAREAGDPDVLEGDEIQRRDLQRIEAMLRGQVAGVHVEQQGATWTVRIRGAESFGVTSADPLFVVDGLPIALGVDNPLQGLNPRDVASIRVLKNASDTAMYGSRGANGVILITTHRPPDVPADSAGAAPE